MFKLETVLGVVLIVGCGDSSMAPTNPAPAGGFAPPVAPAGYTRYVTPTVTGIQPGMDQTYCQWLAGPSDSDQMIADVSGYQSVGGHHMALYATTVKEKVGTNRPCTDEDMLSVTFIGAIGGEGMGGVKLPSGLGFKLPKGSAMMANTHYINAGLNDITGQTVVDVKVADPGAPLKPVGFFAVNNDSLQIPAHTESVTSVGSCVVKQTLSFFMWGNHMHEYGSSVFSDLKRQDGTTVRLATDDNWTQEKTFDTPWVKWDMTHPMVVQPGDILTVSCTWKNSTDMAIGFPREMCVADGFTLEPIDLTTCEAM